MQVIYLFPEISDPESVYVSRKLLIRQMQKQIAQVGKKIVFFGDI